MNQALGLHGLLQASTAEVHERLEALTFTRLLMEKKLPRSAIVNLYHCLEIIHRALEKTETTTPAKLPLILADQVTLQSAEEAPAISKATQAAEAFSREIFRHTGDRLYRLGVEYVLEGSQNGGVFLKAHYADNLGLPKESISYFGCYGNETRNVWREFCRKLNEADLDEIEQRQVCEAAQGAFEWIREIYTALSP